MAVLAVGVVMTAALVRGGVIGQSPPPTAKASSGARPSGAGATAPGSAGSPSAGSMATATRSAIFPPQGLEEAARPLGTPPPATATAGFRFMITQVDGVTPVTYDPCRPIHYVTRSTAAPPGGNALLESAIAEVSRATGLRFVNDGATSETASRTRRVYLPARYGPRWAPVLIDWQTPAENPDFAGTMAGLGGSNRINVEGHPTSYVTGVVQLDTRDLGVELKKPGGKQHVRAVILHELGHLVGLDHVADPHQLMYPDGTGTVTTFGSGDLAGLARLGSGSCAPWL